MKKLPHMSPPYYEVAKLLNFENFVHIQFLSKKIVCGRVGKLSSSSTSWYKISQVIKKKYFPHMSRPYVLPKIP